MKKLIFSAIALMAAFDSRAEGPKSPLTSCQVYERTAFGATALNAILKARGINEFVVQAKLVDLPSDPHGVYEAAAMTLAGGAKMIGFYKNDLVSYVPRVADYRTTKGNRYATSCYVYVVQHPDFPNRAYVNSRQCNYTLGLTAAIPNAEIVTNFYAGVVEFDNNLQITKVQVLAPELEKNVYGALSSF